MKTYSWITLVTMALAIASPAKAYQATGPILELTDSKIVIQKDKEKWEFARSTDTKVTGELKVGSKVTIEYSMSASSIEVKPDKDAKPASKPAAKVEPKPAKAK